MNFPETTLNWILNWINFGQNSNIELNQFGYRTGLRHPAENFFQNLEAVTHFFIFMLRDWAFTKIDIIQEGRRSTSRKPFQNLFYLWHISIGVKPSFKDWGQTAGCQKEPDEENHHTLSFDICNETLTNTNTKRRK